jgi:hypothetical protein
MPILPAEFAIFNYRGIGQSNSDRRAETTFFNYHPDIGETSSLTIRDQVQFLP